MKSNNINNNLHVILPSTAQNIYPITHVSCVSDLSIYLYEVYEVFISFDI